jgi:hypothetical protein
MTDAVAQRPKLSKSRYMAGRQCQLRLWYSCYSPELGAPADAATQVIFDTGHVVGQLATKRHPGGVLITEDHLHHDEALERTARAMSDPNVPAIFEAAFIHQDVRMRADILLRRPRGTWDLIEVKSSLSVKEVNVEDLAVQAWIARGAGLRIGRAGVLTLSRDYVYAGGEHEVDGLFVLQDCTADVRRRSRHVSRHVAAMHAMLAEHEAPAISPGAHCFEPNTCQFYAHCTRDLVTPEYPLTELPSLRHRRLAELVALDIDSIGDIPAEASLSALQGRVRDAVQSGEPFVSPDLARALAEPRYPIHHLDFETFAPALPLIIGTRPYQTIPFQWSNHIEHADGSLTHEEFLCRQNNDPRQALVETMLASLGTSGSICIYTGYEVRIIRELATALPHAAKTLGALERRIWDLNAVIKAHYYHPQFHGSFSLKSVLPAVVPEMSYAGLAIQDGQAAARAYVQALTDGTRRVELHRQLLDYCGLDTLAMVKLRQVLAALASSTA